MVIWILIAFGVGFFLGCIISSQTSYWAGRIDEYERLLEQEEESASFKNKDNDVAKSEHRREIQ